jgi:hypothetical protein
VKLTTHLHLVPKIRMVELYLHSYILLRGVVLNQLRIGTIVPLPLVASQLREHVCRQLRAGALCHLISLVSGDSYCLLVYLICACAYIVHSSDI